MCHQNVIYLCALLFAEKRNLTESLLTWHINFLTLAFIQYKHDPNEEQKKGDRVTMASY